MLASALIAAATMPLVKGWHIHHSQQTIGTFRRGTGDAQLVVLEQLDKLFDRFHIGRRTQHAFVIVFEARYRNTALWGKKPPTMSP